MHNVTLIPGDAPETTAGVRKVLDATGVSLSWDEQKGPIGPAVLESARRTRAVLMGYTRGQREQGTFGLSAGTSGLSQRGRDQCSCGLGRVTSQPGRHGAAQALEPGQPVGHQDRDLGRRERQEQAGGLR